MTDTAAAAIESQLGTVHQGDCVAGMNGLPAESVQLVFADPPFNIGYKYDEYDDKLESEHYLDWSRQWIAGVHRILDPTGAFWLAIGDEYAAELKVASQEIGFHCRSWVIWYYTFGVHCTNKFTRSHAHLFHFVKDPKKFAFHRSEIAVPSARQLVYGDKRANPKGRTPDDTWILRPQDCVDGFTTDEDVWYFPRVAGTFKERAGFHGCQMPEQLLGRIIKSSSSPGDVVVDPFSGSGTTLAVAKKLDRRFAGFEMSKDYAKLGCKRLEQIGVGDLLDGAEEPLASAPATNSAKARRSKNAPPEETPFADGRLDFEPIAGQSDGVLEAFTKAGRGYSVDRLVADPILNQDFQTQCDRRDVPGTPAERNRFLFRMRKTGRLKQAEIATTERTRLEWSEMDPCLFASEIAWRRTSELYAGVGLDEILCDPRLAAAFDEMASKLAPGFSPLMYRWGALKLRKERHQIAARLEARTNEQLQVRKFRDEDLVDLNRFDWDTLSNQSAVYAICDNRGNHLYAGETENLKARLNVQFAAGTQAAGLADSASVFTYPVGPIREARLARQARLLGWYRPKWNFNDQIKS